MSRGSMPLRRGAVGLLSLLVAMPFLPGMASAAAAEEAARPVVKPLLTGLLDRNGPPPAGLEKVVRSYVVHVLWRDLQPSAGGPVATAALDQALDAARDRGARVKLRVMAGVSSPEWAKHLGGPPLTMTEPAAGASGTVPRFWTPEFGAAYADLQAQLAARYDDDPVLAEVVVSRCTVFYAEPFIRQTSRAGNRTALLDAGYTRSADKTCHRQEVDAHRVWDRTRSGLAFNPAQFVTASGARVVDDDFTVTMMRYCREQLGRRCVLENMSIRSPISALDPNPKQPHYQRMYRAMRAKRTPLAFQTATPARIGSCAKTLRWAVRRGAAYVELPHDVAAAGCSAKVLGSAARRLGRPPAPRQVEATRVRRRDSVRVSWAAPPTRAGLAVRRYRILRKIGTGPARRVASLTASRREWADDPRRGSRVVYRVVAVNVAGPGPGGSARLTTD